MRLFVGLPLASEVPSELSEAVARLRDSHDGLRWTTTDTWHITLQFLGNTDQQHCECVLLQLAQIRARQFEIRLGEFGFFDRAGVFFVDVIQGADLVALAKQVIAATSKCGFVAEARPYHPHITLARAKGHSMKDLHEGVRRETGKSGSRELSFLASEFLLYQSHTLPEGARYEVQGRFPLVSQG